MVNGQLSLIRTSYKYALSQWSSPTHLKNVFIKTTLLKDIKKTAAEMVSSKIQAYSTAT